MPPQTDTLRIDADFPGGNVILDEISGDDVRLHQDLRDTEGWWFYWYFRVRGAAGRTLTFHFTDGDPIGVRGPAAAVCRSPLPSREGGRGVGGVLTWAWLGKEAVDGPSFRYAFPDDADEVRFCFAMPYLEANLREFLARRQGNPNLEASTLCETRKGRAVERLRVGRLDGDCEHRVALTCRHHACEMMADYTLEGIIEAVLADDDDGAWFRERVEFLIIPFMDKDGVEDGDQGKNRRPRDHNRDYLGESIYPSVGAIRELAPQWSEGKLRLMLDLHCPYIRGETNEWVYLVGMEEQAHRVELQRFSAILEESRIGPLPYLAENNLPFGQGWNTGDEKGISSTRWFRGIPELRLAATIEIPYANASGESVTPESARALGHDLARAMQRYLNGA